MGNPAFGVPVHLLQMVQEENAKLQQRRYPQGQELEGGRGGGVSEVLGGGVLEAFPFPEEPIHIWVGQCGRKRLCLFVMKCDYK